MTVRDTFKHGVRRLAKVLPRSEYEALRRLYHWRSRWRPPESYSQTGEDVILRHILPETAGFYVDVGAGRATQGNNTYFFYRRGWSGVCIDPIADNVSEISRVRPRDRTLLALCSNAAEPRTFYEFSDYEYSTVDASRVPKILKVPGMKLIAAATIDAVTLASLGARATPAAPSLLSVDVEGHEMSVLESNDWSAFLPRAVCIEELDAPLRKVTDVMRFLAERGYVLKACTGLSSIYVHRDYAASAPAA